ncbi:MAG: helix-turn-helix domain-containing protein [Chloroflexi bacterium]|nr:helix-turn-helix domain-containing protein [Chloroflexota bacterium]
MNDKKCEYQGCQELPLKNLFFGPKPYCKEHYLVAVETAFLDELPSLKAGNPSERCMYLFGRYAEAIFVARRIDMPEALAPNKLRDRAENIQFKDNAITFYIVRHPQPVPTRQWWCLDLNNRDFYLLREEPTYLDCQEIAGELGVSVQTVYRYIKRGKLKANRLKDVEEVKFWFKDKSERGSDYFPPDPFGTLDDKWLISREEFLRFTEKYIPKA